MDRVENVCIVTSHQRTPHPFGTVVRLCLIEKDVPI